MFVWILKGPFLYWRVTGKGLTEVTKVDIEYSIININNRQLGAIESFDHGKEMNNTQI